MVDIDEDDLEGEHYEVIDIQDEEDNSNNDAGVIEEEHGVEVINDEVSDNQSEADDFYDDAINDEISVTNECEADDLTMILPYCDKFLRGFIFASAISLEFCVDLFLRIKDHVAKSVGLFLRTRFFSEK